MLLLLMIAGSRAEYRCHHNIGQDYCEPVRPLLFSATPALPVQPRLRSQSLLCVVTR